MLKHFPMINNKTDPKGVFRFQEMNGMLFTMTSCQILQYSICIFEISQIFQDLHRGAGLVTVTSELSELFLLISQVCPSYDQNIPY